MSTRTLPPLDAAHYVAGVFGDGYCRRTPPWTSVVLAALHPQVSGNKTIADILISRGGEEVLLDVGGQDSTEAFEDVGHSDEAREILEGLYVGKLERKVHLEFPTFTSPLPLSSASFFLQFPRLATYSWMLRIPRQTEVPPSTWGLGPRSRKGDIRNSRRRRSCGNISEHFPKRHPWTNYQTVNDKAWLTHRIGG